MYSQRGNEAMTNNFNKNNVLWYKAPPTKYWEGLPIGTGRFAAMIHGTPKHELITFNDETLWTGSPHNPNNLKGAVFLQKSREHVLAKRYSQADQEILNAMSIPKYTQCYQAMASLHIIFDEHEHKQQQIYDYRRWLDMNDGLAVIEYKKDNVTYTREIFASYPDQVIVIRLAADCPNKISFFASFDSLHEASESFVDEDGVLVIKGNVKDCLSTGRYEYNPVIESKMRYQASL